MISHQSNVGHRMHTLLRLSTIATATLLASVASARAQIPDEFSNLQLLPESITRDSLLNVMRGFSFALGVRCQYCHVGGDGVSFAGVEFHSDDDPDKRKARFMWRMVQRLNEEILPNVPDRDTPATEISCKTCHRGVPKPILLAQEMGLAMESGGVDDAVARYRELRENFLTSGTYDFGEWEVNPFAESLVASGQLRDAIVIYELNLEYFPASTSILGSLGGLYVQVGDSAAAIGYYERVLQLRPNDTRTAERLEALRGPREAASDTMHLYPGDPALAALEIQPYVSVFEVFDSTEAGRTPAGYWKSHVQESTIGGRAGFRHSWSLFFPQATVSDVAYFVAGTFEPTLGRVVSPRGHDLLDYTSTGDTVWATWVPAGGADPVKRSIALDRTRFAGSQNLTLAALDPTPGQLFHLHSMGTDPPEPGNRVVFEARAISRDPIRLPDGRNVSAWHYETRWLPDAPGVEVPDVTFQTWIISEPPYLVRRQSRDRHWVLTNHWVTANSVDPMP